MLTAKLHSAHRLLITLALLFVGAVLALAVQSGTRAETTGEPCGPDVYLIKPAAGTVLSGNTNIEVYVPQIAQATNVKIITDNLFLGEAVKQDPYIWKLQWNSSSITSQPVNLYARVFYSSGSANGLPSSGSCLSEPVNALVETSTAQSELRIETNNKSWSGPTSVNTQFKVFAYIENTDGTNTLKQEVTDQATIKWSTDIGFVKPQGRYATFSSGSTPGSGEVRVTVSYGGQTKHKTIDILVLSQEEASTYPFNGSTDDSEDKDTDDSTSGSETENEKDGTTSATNPLATGYGDEVVNDCFSSVLGERFEEIIKNGERLRYEEIRLVRNCLASRRFVLPSNLAPIAPERVASLPQDDKLTIETPTQATDASGNDSGLILKGKAQQNSDVVIYIFSEPLVLTTQADEDGNWTYVLEDPLEPGEHQVYATVEEDGQFVRSASFSLSLESVASTEENPNGLSLSLSTGDDLTGYILGALALISTGVVAFMLVIHRRTQVYHPHAPKPESHDGVPG